MSASEQKNRNQSFATFNKKKIKLKVIERYLKYNLISYIWAFLANYPGLIRNRRMIRNTDNRFQTDYFASGANLTNSVTRADNVGTCKIIASGNITALGEIYPKILYIRTTISSSFKIKNDEILHTQTESRWLYEIDFN